MIDLIVTFGLLYLFSGLLFVGYVFWLVFKRIKDEKCRYEYKDGKIIQIKK